ncbi:hypothetical protein [Pseudomonas sp. NPDC089758]|uniref:ribonuclease T2 family protein n=1 Tax=Pseudomonas sp. NPDC089758 TaxID=3364473 RepID=UPI00380E7C2A
MRVMTTTLLLLTLVGATRVMALDRNEEAYVDAPPSTYLVYSVTWQPTFCIMRPSTAGCERAPQRFLTHGIWPYSESIGKLTNRHPQYCTQSPDCTDGEACAMSADDMNAVLANKALRDIVTREPMGMFAHEWRKHGTCSGKGMQAYFQDFVDLRKVVRFDNEAFNAMVGNATAFSKIRDAFPENTAFRCYQDPQGKQYLHEVFYLVDDNGTPYTEEKNLQIGVQCKAKQTWIPAGAKPAS